MRVNEGHVSSLRLWTCSKCLCSVITYQTDACQQKRLSQSLRCS